MTVAKHKALTSKISVAVGTAVVILLASMLNATARAAKVDAECPEEIKTKQSASAPVKGWTADVDTATTRQIFTGLTMYDGPPKDGVLLLSDESSAEIKFDGANKSAATSDSNSVSGNGLINDVVYKIPAGREAYVACLYTGTLVRLIRKLPKDLQICRVRFSETLGHVQKVVCD